MAGTFLTKRHESGYVGTRGRGSEPRPLASGEREALSPLVERERGQARRPFLHVHEGVFLRLAVCPIGLAALEAAAKRFCVPDQRIPLGQVVHGLDRSLAAKIAL